MASRGAFILFEGVDRTGKTTQSLRLVEYLRSQSIPVRHMRFPDRTSPIGKMIDGYLKQQQQLDDHAIHLLYSANRWECVSEIYRTLQEGVTIVMDRFVSLSSNVEQESRESLFFLMKVLLFWCGLFGCQGS
jgi:dTMP kinase